MRSGQEFWGWIGRMWVVSVCCWRLFSCIQNDIPHSLFLSFSLFCFISTEHGNTSCVLFCSPHHKLQTLLLLLQNTSSVWLPFRTGNWGRRLLSHKAEPHTCMHCSSNTRVSFLLIYRSSQYVWPVCPLSSRDMLASNFCPHEHVVRKSVNCNQRCLFLWVKAESQRGTTVRRLNLYSCSCVKDRLFSLFEQSERKQSAHRHRKRGMSWTHLLQGKACACYPLTDWIPVLCVCCRQQHERREVISTRTTQQQ